MNNFPITPVEERDGRWYKREDLYRHPTGVNGAKYRQCGWLVQKAAERGAKHLITGASVISPQHAMTAVEAQKWGLTLTNVVGGTKEETLNNHPSIKIARSLGSNIDIIPVGYNPALQRRVKDLAKEPDTEIIHYGISIAPDASPEDKAEFHMVGAPQVQNLPDNLDTLILPFGSGNSSASVLTGLHVYNKIPNRILLVGIGPSRWNWLQERLLDVADGLGMKFDSLPIDYHDLHKSKEVSYTHGVPYKSDGITLHPHYEGKIANWLNKYPDVAQGWAERDGSTCLWIVGGPMN